MNSSLAEARRHGGAEDPGDSVAHPRFTGIQPVARMAHARSSPCLGASVRSLSEIHRAEGAKGGGGRPRRAAGGRGSEGGGAGAGRPTAWPTRRGGPEARRRGHTHWPAPRRPRSSPTHPVGPTDRGAADRPPPAGGPPAGPARPGPAGPAPPPPGGAGGAGGGGDSARRGPAGRGGGPGARGPPGARPPVRAPAEPAARGAPPAPARARRRGPSGPPRGAGAARDRAQPVGGGGRPRVGQPGTTMPPRRWGRSDGSPRADPR